MGEMLLQSCHHWHFPSLGSDAGMDTRRLPGIRTGASLWDLDRALGFHRILSTHAQTQQNLPLGSFPPRVSACSDTSHFALR